MPNMIVTLSINPHTWDAFKKLCNDRGEKFSKALENMMAVELSRALDTTGESMPMFQDDKLRWVSWFKKQDDPTLKEVADKFGLLNIYALAYLSVSSTRREEASFNDYQTALHFAKKVA